MHLLNSLLKDPVLITLIVVIGGGCILRFIVNFVVHRQSVKFFPQNGATEGSNDATANGESPADQNGATEGSNDATANGESPADQGSTARNRGAGDTNGNGVKRMVCGENTTDNNKSPADLSGRCLSIGVAQRRQRFKGGGPHFMDQLPEMGKGGGPNEGYREDPQQCKRLPASRELRGVFLHSLPLCNGVHGIQA